MKIPGKLGGTHPLVRWLNDLRDIVLANKLNSLKGGKILRGPDGVNLVIDQDDTRMIEVIVCENGTEKTYVIKGYEKKNTN